jgi:hypothetical protein
MGTIAREGEPPGHPLIEAGHPFFFGSNRPRPRADC